MNSPRILLAELVEREMFRQLCSSMRDTRPVGAVIEKLPPRERETLSRLTSEEIRSDILRDLIKYKYRWNSAKNFPSPSFDEWFEMETAKFDKKNEKFIRQFYHSNL